MDLKLIIRALEFAFPQIGNAITWIRKHVKKYSIKVEQTTIKIQVEVDNEKNAKEVKKHLNNILEAILT